MQPELLDTLEHLKAAFAAGKQEDTLRKDLQTYFDIVCNCERTATPDRGLLAARVGGLRLVRALQNSTMPQQAAPVASVSLSALCESTSFCADLLCAAATRKRVFFTGETEITAACRPRPVLWTTLNLLSNALLYSTGRYVFVNTAYAGNKAVVTVSGEGAFSVPAFFAAQTRTSSGLWFAAQAARLHGGGLYLSKSAAFASVSFSLPIAPTDLPQWVLPDFTDWLSDGLSPIYTALCDSIFPNSAK